jgi:hypothetical protein
MKNKEKIEIKEQNEKNNSDKAKEEGTEEGEESVGRRHWSQFNYRSTATVLLISFRF